jgi:hypothetical protein
MAYTTTTRLGLEKAVVGSNQAFETASINSNWDKVDAEAVAADSRLDAIETLNTTQNNRLTTVEGRATTLEGRATTLESRATTIEGVNTTQGSSITALETKTNSGIVYNSARVGGRTVFAQSSTPTALATGDIWIQIP